MICITFKRLRWLWDISRYLQERKQKADTIYCGPPYFFENQLTVKVRLGQQIHNNNRTKMLWFAVLLVEPVMSYSLRPINLILFIAQCSNTSAYLVIFVCKKSYEYWILICNLWNVNSFDKTISNHSYNPFVVLFSNIFWKI